VTLAMIAGLIHDVFLSPVAARDQAFAELDTFLAAYVERGP
jgi:alpha-beta hydrolase superfamily lysophospholipase